MDSLRRTRRLQVALELVELIEVVGEVVLDLAFVLPVGEPTVLQLVGDFLPPRLHADAPGG